MASIPRRPYTPAEWEAKKDIILQLRQDGKPQAQILKELEKRFPDFRPTLPMLKKRMKDWKITSYHKDSDIAEAVRITADREKINKRTILKIGDKWVSQEDILKYLRRKHVRNQRTWASKVLDSKQPVSTIEPYTPPPTPPATGDSDEPEEQMSANELDSLRFQAARHTFISTYSQEHIRVLIQGPHESEMLSKALWNTDFYCQKLFFTEDRSPGLSDLTSDQLNDFTNAMWKGWDFLFDDNPGAFDYFRAGFISLEKLVKSHNRRFLPELLEMLLNLQLEPQIDILEKLLRQISGLCREYSLTDDMLYHIIESLLALDNTSRLEAVDRLMNNVRAHFTFKLGQGNPETKSIEKALTRSAFRKLPVSKAISRLEYMFQEEPSAGTSAMMNLYNKCNICIELALCYRSQTQRDPDKIVDVEAWITQAMLLASGLDSEFHRADIRVRCHRVMSYVERKKGNWQTAYEHWKDAVVESSDGLGSTDSLTVLVESELADFMARASLNGVALVDEPVAVPPPVGFVEVESDLADTRPDLGGPLTLGNVVSSREPLVAAE
ncbi:hypothetical protein ABW20_dc0100696 [Dactylellina cionopaga]|nr:hypothetical protein ABW20_dc0100696 [Dactylellina cionopaga]